MKLPVHKPIALLAILLLSIIACMKKKYPQEYKFVSLEIENASAENKFPAFSSDTSINAGIYCIRTQLTAEKIQNASINHSSLLNTTPIDSLFITSDKDFNGMFLAGDNLASLFRIYKKSYYDLVVASDFESRDLEGFSSTENDTFQFYSYLLLTEKPTILGARKFYVKMVSNTTHFLDSLEINLY